jgi:hypothetical protein
MVVIVDVPPHPIAGNEGNHGDICAVEGFVSGGVGDIKEPVDVEVEG